MKKLLFLFTCITWSFVATAQQDMTVTNFTNDMLLVQGRVELNGAVVGYNYTRVMPNSTTVLRGVNNSPNARWEAVRGIAIFNRQKYALDFFNSNINDLYQGLFVTRNSNQNVVFY